MRNWREAREAQAGRIRESRIFDPDWYLKRYPDVARAKVDPAIHYLTHGPRNGRDPGPYFSTKWYLEQYPEVAESRCNPLLDYLTVGARLGRNPSPDFESAFYLERYPDVAAAGVNPLEHFLKFGISEKRFPTRAAENNAKETRPSTGQEAAQPSSNWREVRRVLANRIQKSGILDAKWYLERYPDVAKANEEPAIHYLTHGVRDRRDPGPYFSTSWYLERYPEVAQAGQNPLLDYLDNAVRLGRNPNPDFDTTFYLSQNPDVAEAGVNPLEHWIKHGRQEGRETAPKAIPNQQDSCPGYLNVDLTSLPEHIRTTRTYENEVLKVRLRLDREYGALVAGAPMELMAGNIVLGRVSLELEDNDGGYTALFSTPCTDRTLSDHLFLHLPFANTRIPLFLLPEDAGAPAAPVEIAQFAEVVEGAFDGIRLNSRGLPVVHGWARDLAVPGQAVIVDILIDGVPFGAAYAIGARADVAARRGGSEICGFQFEIPPNFRAGESFEVSITPRALRSTIQPPTRSVTMAPYGLMLTAKRRCAGGPWQVARGQLASATMAAVILNQDGSRILDDLFSSICRHDPDGFNRIVVIDHDSADDSEGVVNRYKKMLPIEFIPRHRDASFAESNNFAAKLCTEDILVFMNNDIVLREGITARLRAEIGPGVGIVGVRLLDPAPPGLQIQSQQHVGIHFSAASRAAPLPFESRVLTDWVKPDHQSMTVPAVTAALCAVARTTFDEIGGFNERFYYGWEDIDLCMRALAHGLENVCVNSVSATHIRGYSRRVMPVHLNDRRVENPRIFDALWGYSLRRSLGRDLLANGGYWNGRALNVGFVVSEARPEATAGDYMTALELGEALVGELDAKVMFFEKHTEVDAREVDILVVMTDDFDVRKVKSLSLNAVVVAWARNWFHRWAAREWRERFDVWFASSRTAAEYLTAELGRHIAILPIATAVDRFASGTRVESFAADVAFTGHRWSSPRDLEWQLKPDGYTMKIFGAGWENVPALKPYAHGALPYDRMPDVYKSVKIVVDDSNFATREWGSVNSRVFDAIAAGTLVVSNNVKGAADLFGDALPTYTDAQSLDALLRDYLQDDHKRAAVVAKLQGEVRTNHSYSERAKRFVSRLRERAGGGLRIAIKIGAPRLQAGEGWGDLHFARALRRELERLGHSVRIDCLADWRDKPGRDDANIVLRGLERFPPDPNQINIVWIISHCDKISPAELQGYDRIFSASRKYARAIEEFVSKNVQYLPQCTDEKRFHPPTDPNPRHGAVFVANSRKVRRPVGEAAYRFDLDISIYGEGWKGLVPERFVKGGVIPNSRVGDLYRSAAVVLNDHWEDMRKWGFVSNRLFDAVACEAAVITDSIEGLQELFGDVVSVFDSIDEMPMLLDRALIQNDEDLRRRKEAAARVLAEHTFAARARVLDKALRGVDEQRDRLARHGRTNSDGRN
jgi:spore maturation protein CgeB/GT2 family glycosyltransferase